MKNRIKYLRKIERFLNGEMDETEKAKFETELLENPELAEEYREHLEIYKAISDKEVIELRQQLKNIHSILHGKLWGGRILPRWYHWSLMAAAILFLTGLMFVLMMIIKPVMSEKQFATMISQDSTLAGDAFQLLPVYRNLLVIKVRSEDFDLITPRDSSVFAKGEAVTFRWKTSFYQPVMIEVINSRGMIVSVAGIPPEDHYVLKEELNRGIYIFRLQSETRTLYYGVFFIR
jgi:hypothetical protein